MNKNPSQHKQRLGTIIVIKPESLYGVENIILHRKKNIKEIQKEKNFLENIRSKTNNQTTKKIVL